MAKKKRKRDATGEINQIVRRNIRAGGASAKEARDVTKRHMPKGKAARRRER